MILCSYRSSRDFFASLQCSQDGFVLPAVRKAPELKGRRQCRQRRPSRARARSHCPNKQKPVFLGVRYVDCFFTLFQEAARSSKAAALSPDDVEEAESPMPSQLQQSVRRRGAISAEPITEEDVASYVKKVKNQTGF